MDPLDDFLQQQREEGEYHSSGAFTLAYQQASRRLASFQRAHPRYFVWKFVQAAVVSGAREVRFERGRGGLRAVGGRWEAEDLDRLERDLVSAQLADSARPLHYLANCLGAALATRRKWISLRLTAGKTVHSVRYDLGPEGYRSGRHQTRTRPGAEPGLELLLAGGVRLDSLRLSYAPLRWGSLNVVGRLCPLAEIHRGPPEASGVIVANLEAAWLDATLAGQHESARIVLRCEQGRFLKRVAVSYPGPRVDPPVARLVVLVFGGRVRPTRVSFVKYGLEMAPVAVDWGWPGVDVAVEGDDLACDVSGLQLVKDDVLRARLGEIRQEVGAALAQTRAMVRDELPAVDETLEGDARFWERLGQSVVVGGLLLGVVLLQPMAAVLGTASGLGVWRRGTRMGGARRRFQRLVRALDQSLGL